MPLSAIVQVLLRLAALNWFITGMIQGIVTPFQAGPSESFVASQLVTAGVILILGIIFWIFAPFLSRLFTQGADEPVSLAGVSLRSLYSTAFVGLGLWFALKNFPRIFNGIHFYITASPQEASAIPSRITAFYNLSEAALTFLAGLVLVATARIWAGKLTKSPNNQPQ